MQRLRALLGPLRGAAGAAALSLSLSAGGTLLCAEASAAAPPPGASPAPALDVAAFKAFRLASVEALSPDTNRYTFELPRPSDSTGLVAASYLLVRAPAAELAPGDKPAAAGAFVVRPYTPTSPADARGAFELVVKAYGPPAPAPPAGIGAWLARQPVGATVDVRGAAPKFTYEPNAWRAVGMVAGGSGITPMLQLVRAILDNPRDRTEIRLIYANKTEADIVLKDELDALAATHPQFKVVYTLDSPPAGWKVRARGAARRGASPAQPCVNCARRRAPPPPPRAQGATGFVTEELIRSALPPPVSAGADGSVPFKIFVCGPPPMVRALAGEKKSPADQGPLAGALAALGYDKAAVYKY